MAWASLKMISLGSLLFLGEQTYSSPVKSRSRCMSEHALNRRAARFKKLYWERQSVSIETLLSLSNGTWTCARAAGQTRDLRHRSLAPWTYSLNRDMERFPHEVAFAECLCQGCIINQREDLRYNSVPVFAPLMVLRKTRCPNVPDKYLVKKEYIKVPVACTCAVPKYTE